VFLNWLIYSWLGGSQRNLFFPANSITLF